MQILSFGAMDDRNLTGAIIFWLYIVAALVLSTLVVRSIYRTPNSRSADAYGDVIRLFCLLAGLSFGTLSFQMLRVLIDSYKHWAQLHHVLLPSRLLGRGGLVGSGRTELQLWEWSTTSTLFQDFGEAIVATHPRYLWTSAELWATYIITLFMGIKGD